MFLGRRLAIFCAALVVGIMTWGVVAGVSAASLLPAAGSPPTTSALSDTTTTTVNLDTTTTTVKSDTTTTIAKRDLCPNIDGVQASVPTGMFINAKGDCVRRIVDLCPNIKGVQTTVPVGMFVNAAGNCVRIVDLCPNIPGVQATVPAGLFVGPRGNCVAKAVGIAKPISELPILVVCAIGDIGPGGGIVFYDAGSHQSWGQCLEAAPNTWRGGTADPQAAWGCQGMFIGAQGIAIGTGQANTTAIVNTCTTTGIAARLANNLVFGGESDWFLPSTGELAQMYAKRSIIGGFAALSYWSSSENGSIGASRFNFGGGTGGGYQVGQKTVGAYIRPIRAFG